MQLLFKFIDKTFQSFPRNFQLCCSYRLCLKMIKTSNTVEKKRSFACCEFPVTNEYVILKS